MLSSIIIVIIIIIVRCYQVLRQQKEATATPGKRGEVSNKKFKPIYKRILISSVIKSSRKLGQVERDGTWQLVGIVTQVNTQ